MATELDCDIMLSAFKLQLHDYIHFLTNTFSSLLIKSPYVIVANVLDCDIILSAFKLQSPNYIQFGLIILRNV